MKIHLAPLLAVAFMLSPLHAAAEEKQIVDVKELAGTWQGWVTREGGRDRATIFVSEDGSYRALTAGGATTEGRFYLQDDQLRYRSSRTTGAASLSEDQGKTMLRVTPADPTYHTGRGEYERVK